MKVFGTFLVLAVVAVYSLPVLEDVDSEWSKFKATYGKIYKSALQEKQRKAVFESNYKLIDEHNELYKNGKSSFFLKINKLADLTSWERSVLKSLKRNNLLSDIEIDTFVPDPNVDIPDTFDWRTKGAVTRVKDQGQCGSAWAFSTTGALEAAYSFKTGDLVELSEQNLVDCIKNDDNDGCDEGDMLSAYTYIYHNDGIDSDKSYPYEAEDGYCRYDESFNVTSIRGYGLIKKGSEGDLKAAVATLGPISITIDASQDSFDFYGGGVYFESRCSTDDLDHTALAVGYGSQSGDQYWLVKNSWSEDWGEAGYIKMSRNKDNNCGIATEAVYPLMY